MNHTTYTVTTILISNCTGMLLVRELSLVEFALSLKMQKEHFLLVLNIKNVIKVKKKKM